jgi:hypothetical protein
MLPLALMKTAALCFASVLTLTSSALAPAQVAPPAPPLPPGAAQPSPNEAVPLPVQPTSPPAGVEVAPPASPQQQGYAAQPPPPATTTMGQWVHTIEFGWIWVPPDASTVLYDGAPYAYLYTPANGWNWYVSPWGPGRYHSGNWVRHAWRPRAARPFVAPPAVGVRLEPMRRVAQPHVYEERGENRGRR